MNIQEIRQQYPQYQDLSDDQLGKALHSKYYADMPYEQFATKAGIKSVGVGEDIAKTIGPSAVRGMTNLAGAPADIWETISGGMAKGFAHLVPEHLRQLVIDAAKPELPLPTSKRIQGGVEKVTGELYKPQTRAGKIVGGTVEAAAPGGMFGKAQTALGAISGLGSEVAGAATNDNPWAKAGGGLLAPLGAQGALAYRSIPGNMIRGATGDVTPQQFEGAKQFMERAKQQGVPLMAPEAMPASSIQPLLSDVIASKEGGRVVNQFLAQRPEQVKKAVSGGLLDRVGMAATPDENMARVKGVADDVISGAEKFRTEATRPHYQAQKVSDLEGMLLESRLPGLMGDADKARRSHADLLGIGGRFQTLAAENTTRAHNWVPVPGMPRVPGRVGEFLERAMEGASAARDVSGRIPQSRKAMQAAQAEAESVRGALDAKGYSKVSEGLESVIGNIDSEIALAGAGSDKAKILRELRDKLAPNGVPLDKPYKLEGVYQETSKRLNVPINAPVQDRVAAGVLGEHVGAINALVQETSPVIKQGRALYKEMTERVVNPLTSGPVGRVAGKQGFDPALPENLNPISAIANEKLARPESIRELYTHINKQDPKAFPGLARTWLENAFDGAAQKVQSGENRMVGANFTKAVFGTPQQEANFAETMRGVAVANGKNPDDFARGAKNLMEILQATGKVAGAGSPTGGRIASNEMARSSRWAASLEMASAAPLRPMANKLRELTMGSNYKKLAEILTAPDSIDRIIKIGKYKPTTTTSMALAIGLLEANAEAGSAR